MSVSNASLFIEDQSSLDNLVPLPSFRYSSLTKSPSRKGSGNMTIWALGSWKRPFKREPPSTA